jgi:hypothetical protein
MPRNGPKLNYDGRFRGVTRRQDVAALGGRDVRMWNMKLSQSWTNGPLTLAERKIRDVFHKALACLESEHQGTSSNPLAFALPGEKEEIIRSLRAARTDDLKRVARPGLPPAGQTGKTSVNASPARGRTARWPSRGDSPD